MGKPLTGISADARLANKVQTNERPGSNRGPRHPLSDRSKNKSDSEPPAGGKAIPKSPRALGEVLARALDHPEEIPYLLPCKSSPTRFVAAIPEPDTGRDGARQHQHRKLLRLIPLEIPPLGGERYDLNRDGSARAPDNAEQRKRGRKPGGISERTVARITIAADLLLTNAKASIYSMTGTLFPEQSDKDLAYSNARRFRRRYEKQLASERKRLGALSPIERAHAVEQAKQVLSA